MDGGQVDIVRIVAATVPLDHPAMHPMARSGHRIEELMVAVGTANVLEGYST